MTEHNRGFGKGKILYLDCFSGVSGDMFISSLIDLGVPVDVIVDAANCLPLSGYGIRAEKEMRKGIQVMRFHVDVDEAVQPHRHYSDIAKMIADSSLDKPVVKLATDIFREIAVAEADVHGTTIDHVHFHEVGAVDSIVDIVGAAAAIDYIGATVVCAPIPLGRGFIQTQHGTLPVPAPATLLILKGVPVEGTKVPAELTTPTGAAILKVMASGYGPIPPMTPEIVGLGAGSRTRDDRPGMLRSVLGFPSETSGMASDACWVLEANIDDMTGELAASAMDALFAGGALDVWLEPIHMKKGRLANKMSVLCKRDALEKMGALMMTQTTTIGLRYYSVGRMEMHRIIDTVDTPYGSIRVKISRGAGNSENAAPEFEDCKTAAATHGVPVKNVMAAATGEALKLLLKK